MAGSGATTISNGASLVISGGNSKSWVQRTINNSGTLTWSGTGNFDAGQGVVLNNQSGGLVDVQNDQTLSYDQGGIFPVINNAGTFRKTGGTGTTTLNSVFNNSGSLDAQSGTLNLAGGGDSHGSFIVRTNAALNFSGGTYSLTNGVSFSDVGTVRFQTPIQIGTNINFGSSAVFFENSASLTGTNTLANGVSGTITFNKSMTVPGSMDIAGKLVIAGASLTVTISGTFTLESSGELNNPGTLNVGAFINDGGTIIGNEPIVLAPILASFRIEQIQWTDPAGPSPLGFARTATANRNLILKWYAGPGQQFRLEFTTDLRTWTDLPAVISESSSGAFQVTLLAEGGGARFYRLRRL